MTDVSTSSVFELMPLPKNLLEGLPLCLLLVSLSITGLNPTDCRLSDLLKQTLCDSLQQLKFLLLWMSFDPRFVRFSWACFDKTSFSAIVQHWKGAINEIGIFMFYLNWNHTHTDNIFLDGFWCTCNFSFTISWFFFTSLTASCHWLFATWLVFM